MSEVGQESDLTRLGEIVTHIRIRTQPLDLPQEDHFVGLEDIAPDGGPIVGSSRVADVKSTVHAFKADDILYGRLRPYLRKVAVAAFDGHASGEIVVLRCSKAVLPGYVRMLLLSEGFTAFISARVKGDRPRTSFEMMAEFMVSLPSIDVQADLVQREERLSQAVVKVEEAVAQYECSASSLLNTVRTKVVWRRNIESPQVPLSKLVHSIQYGTAQKSTRDADGVPVLRIPNISSIGKVDATDLKYAPLSTLNEKYQVREGDVLLIRSNGSLSLLGQAASVSSDYNGYGFAGYLLRLRPRDEVLGAYLLELVRSGPFRKLVESTARSTSGVNNLSASRLGAFSVPFPSKEDQRAVVDVMAKLTMSTAHAARQLADTKASAIALQQAARSYWLGQSAKRYGKVIDSTPVRVPIKLTEIGKEYAMNKNMEAVIFERFDHLSVDVASFDTLVEGVRANYDTLRDTVFKLLNESPPRLALHFDPARKTILLKRI